MRFYGKKNVVRSLWEKKCDSMGKIFLWEKKCDPMGKKMRSYGKKNGHAFLIISIRWAVSWNFRQKMGRVPLGFSKFWEGISQPKGPTAQKFFCVESAYRVESKNRWYLSFGVWALNFNLPNCLLAFLSIKIFLIDIIINKFIYIEDFILFINNYKI